MVDVDRSLFLVLRSSLAVPIDLLWRSMVWTNGAIFMKLGRAPTTDMILSGLVIACSQQGLNSCIMINDLAGNIKTRQNQCYDRMIYRQND